jgi:hypothetical protein
LYQVAVKEMPNLTGVSAMPRLMIRASGIASRIAALPGL